MHLSNMLSITMITLVIICYQIIPISLSATKMTSSEKEKLKLKTLEMFDHAYGSYKKYAFPADELMPLSCKGRYRGTEGDRGDIDEALGNFSLTLIDTLDTLAVLGRIDEFEEQVRFVIQNVSFNTDVVVSVFETNIRVLGGLLGAHFMSIEIKMSGKGMLWYQNELLSKAVDIGDRLLTAFNTTTGIPYPKVNLKYGVNTPYSRVGHETDTCTACAGTMIMEFGALSRLTGNQIYEDKAHKAMEALWMYRSRHSDLVGTTINIHNGNWIRRDSGVGAGIDSYYEYCLKAYILLGDETYLDKFNKHYESIKRYIQRGSMFIDVMMHQPDQPVRSHMDALQAFWPGLLVLKGDLHSAIETHEMLYSVAKKFKFLPEAFTSNFDLHWAQHPLRPEFIESTYFLYQATKDDYYLYAGRHVLETLEEHARVPCGFAALTDVRTFRHEDKMDSFVLAETFKYLYLLFSTEAEHLIDIHDYIFTTEAHLLPLHLSSIPNDRQLSSTKMSYNHDRKEKPIQEDTCPNIVHSYLNLRSFAESIRDNVKKSPSDQSVKTSCKPIQPETSSQSTVSFVFDLGKAKLAFTGQRKLRAEEFQIGNEEHVKILRQLGILVVSSENGKVQLVQQAGTAASVQDAQEGIVFMQEMIQLAKEKGATADIQPSVVQILNGGKVVKQFNAGSAQFGADLTKFSTGVSGEAIETEPFRACKEIRNTDQITNRIAVIERSECMFIDKVRLAQLHGAKAVVIIDHVEGTTSASSQLFGMSGDSNSNDVTIPSVFLYKKEGDELRSLMKQSENTKIEIKIAHKKSEEKDLLNTFSSEEINKNADKPNDVSYMSEVFKNNMIPISDPTEVSSTVDGVVTTITTRDFLKFDSNNILKKITETTEKICPTSQCDVGVRVIVKTKEEDYFDFNKILSKETGVEVGADQNQERSLKDFSKILYQTLGDLKDKKIKNEFLDNALAELKMMASDVLSNIEKLKNEILYDIEPVKEGNTDSSKILEHANNNDLNSHIEKKLAETKLESDDELTKFPRTKNGEN